MLLSYSAVQLVPCKVDPANDDTPVLHLSQFCMSRKQLYQGKIRHALVPVQKCNNPNSSLVQIQGT